MMLTRAISPLAWGAGVRPGEEFFPMPNGLLVAEGLRVDTRIRPQGFCSTPDLRGRDLPAVEAAPGATAPG